MKTSFKTKSLIALAAVVAVLLIFFFKKNDSDETAEMTHTVKRGDFIISVVEGGTLEAVNEVVIKNTIEGESRIITLIPEGTYVKEGDLVAEFDSGKAESNVNDEQVKYESRQAALVTAENDFTITKSTVASNVREAELELQFAEMDLDKFLTLERTHKIRDSEQKINSAEEALKLAQQKYDWSEKLAKKGFETMTQVDRDKLDVSSRSKALETAQSTHKMLQEFDLDKEYAKFLSKKEEAQAKLERVKKQGESKIAQKQAAVNSAKVTLRLTEESLDKKREQLEATKLHAPAEGLVIYAKSSRYWSDEPKIEEGANIRNRREVIKIPDVSSMKVEVKIHESIIGSVKKGQKAYVVLDALPDERFLAEVTKVSILPDSDRSWENPNLKVYTTEITLSDKIEGVKPGVSARAEIIVDELKDVLTVPIQAVTTLNGKQVCYFTGRGEPKPIEVTIGQFNTKYIEIKEGLSEGDQIILNPPFDDKVNLTGEVIEKNSTE